MSFVRAGTNLMRDGSTQTASPFKLAQLVVLALFVLLGVVAAIRFRPEPIRAT